MRHFILTSSKFSGQVSYKYCDSGYLIEFRYEATMNDQQRNWLLSKMPLTIAGFEALIANSDTVKVEEVMLDLSFESFWKTYPHKRNPQRCKPLWEKMSEKNKLQCLQSIEPYKRYVQRRGIAHKDPEGYLRGQEYLNDFNKLN